jgi:NAD(P)-dependent dehydrogenase (short-subunit alcohol dehydrogenase family)
MNESSRPQSTSFRFAEADLQLFARASYDFNPLHTSALYARRSAFGERVVFGILGCCAAMEALPDRAGEVLSELSATFHGPMYLDVDYQVQAQLKNPDRPKLLVRDSGKLVATTTLRFRPGSPQVLESRGTCARSEPLAYRVGEIREGLLAAGVYAPDPAPFEALQRRYALSAKGLDSVQLAILLWSSYLVGMELPGERAVFSRVRLVFAPDPAADPVAGPIEYAARVTGFDPRFNLLQAQSQLAHNGRTLAEAELSALVRDDPPTLSVPLLQKLLPNSRSLNGKLALVTGASRGLGAALVGALASQGCDVLLNYRSGQADAEAVRDLLASNPGRVTLVTGDAGDPNWCESLRNELNERHQALDFLLLNASPPIRPLGLSEQSIARISSFLDQSLRLVIAPLTALLAGLGERRGSVVVISSEYARTAPADFPHYVAAKRAAEGFAVAACGQFPGARLLIVRPPRLVTDQTNTPSAREGALPAEAAAARVVERLRDPSTAESSEILEVFPDPAGEDPPSG